MIEITLSTAFMLYLAATLGTLLTAWSFYLISARHRFRPPHETLLLVCEYCHCAYLEDHSKNVTQCPKCTSFNKNNSYAQSKKE